MQHHGLYVACQARILEWVGIPFSGGSSQYRDQIHVACIAGRFFTISATREAHISVFVCFKYRLICIESIYRLAGVENNVYGYQRVEEREKDKLGVWN